MAKKKAKTPKPKRNAHPLEKAAWMQDAFDRELSKLLRVVNRMQRLRAGMARLGREATKGTRGEGT